MIEIFLRLLEYLKMTTHNLSSDFNIQLSFKLNIEPPENMYTFNIQPSLKLNVEPQENNSILQPIKQKNEKYQEQNNEQLIQILRNLGILKPIMVLNLLVISTQMFFWLFHRRIIQFLVTILLQEQQLDLV